MAITTIVKHAAHVITGTGLLLLACGCAAPRDGTLSAVEQPLPTLDSRYNRIVAWVPQSQAPSASAARNQAFIALARAKKNTEAELCRGQWMFSGSLQQEDSASLSSAPTRMGGHPAWQLRIAWNPQLNECGVSTETYAQTLSRHLPPWMLAQTAQPLTLFHQGVQIPLTPTTLALHEPR